MRRLLPVLLWGCVGTESPTASPTVVPEPQAVLLGTLAFSEVDDEAMTSPGFDLDGVVSTTGGRAGCDHVDYTTPDGAEGIDNSFGGLIPVIEAAGGSALPDLIQASIDAGELLIMAEMIGLDDFESDDCVDVSFLRAAGAPTIGGDGRILPGQTFDRDLDAPGSSVDCATLEDGVLTAAPFSLRLPLEVFDERIDLTLVDGVFELTFEDDGSYTGVFAGAVAIEEVQANVASFDGIGTQLPVIFGAALDIRADLAPDGETCSHMSVVAEFTGVPAFFFE